MSYKTKQWKPLTFEEQVWNCWGLCVTAGRIMEQTSVANNGDNYFESRPSKEAFELQVNVLEQVMNGAGWLSAENLGMLDAGNPQYTKTFTPSLNMMGQPIIINGNPIGHWITQNGQSTPWTPLERFGLLTKWLKARPEMGLFFREKRPKWKLM